MSHFFIPTWQLMSLSSIFPGKETYTVSLHSCKKDILMFWATYVLMQKGTICQRRLCSAGYFVFLSCFSRGIPLYSLNNKKRLRLKKEMKLDLMSKDHGLFFSLMPWKSCSGTVLLLLLLLLSLVFFGVFDFISGLCFILDWRQMAVTGTGSSALYFRSCCCLISLGVHKISRKTLFFFLKKETIDYHQSWNSSPDFRFL